MGGDTLDGRQELTQPAAHLLRSAGGLLLLALGAGETGEVGMLGVREPWARAIESSTSADTSRPLPCSRRV